MKKHFSWLFTLFILCALIFACTVSVSAYSEGKNENGDPCYVVDNGEELANALWNLEQTIKVIHIYLNNTYMETSQIHIRKGNIIYFELNEGIKECTIHSTEDEESMIMIDKAAKGATLYFKSPYIYLEGTNDDGDGGALYIDAERVYVEGATFRNCRADVDGGAICVNRDDCEIEKCYFRNCYAGDDGGGIYFCVGADDGNVSCCDFNFCSCGDEGNNVCGDNDTYIWDSWPNGTNDFADCDMSYYASVFSQGNIWIIISVAIVVVIAVIVFIVMKNKKKKGDGTTK